MKSSATQISLQERVYYPAAAALSSDTFSAQPLEHCLGCKELPPTSRLDLALPRRQDAAVDTRGKRPDCFVPNQDNAEDILISYLPLESSETTVQICQAVESLLLPSPLLSPTDVGSTALPTTH